MKEYIVEEGSSVRVCLEFEEEVQRPFEVNITRLLLDDIIDGNNKINNFSAALLTSNFSSQVIMLMFWRRMN